MLESMDGRSKKELRQKLVAQELHRREREAHEAMPFTVDQLYGLLDHLAQIIDAHGHDGSFKLMSAWLVEHGIKVDESITFFQSQALRSDFEASLFQPNQVLGPLPDRVARLLPREALEALLNHLNSEIPLHRCNDRPRLARAWLESHGFPVAPALFALGAHGGFCDCEILLNVDPARIYPSQAS
jgi:hypothetical protein